VWSRKNLNKTNPLFKKKKKGLHGVDPDDQTAVPALSGKGRASPQVPARVIYARGHFYNYDLLLRKPINQPVKTVGNVVCTAGHVFYVSDIRRVI